MNSDRDYIFEAVEVAYRWFVTKSITNSVDSGIRCMDVDYDWFINEDDLRGKPSGPGVDALAARLIGMVDRHKGRAGEAFTVEVCEFKTEVFVALPGPGYLLEDHHDDGRSMNSIKAIIDSGVFKS